MVGDSNAGTGVFGTSAGQIGVRGILGNYSGVGAFSAGVVGEGNGTNTGIIVANVGGTALEAISGTGSAINAHIDNASSSATA